MNIGGTFVESLPCLERDGRLAFQLHDDLAFEHVDERMGVMKDLIQQSADSINKMSSVVEGLQKQMQAQQEAQSGKADQLSGQIQSLNDSVDEIKARMLERARNFLANAPTTAAQAATIILDGVKAGRWRILVGEDAKRLDELVRREPERAYDADFFTLFATLPGLSAAPAN